MSPAGSRIYWHCGGEILTGGGRFGMASRGRPTRFGCRPISSQRATELWVLYLLKARDASDAAVRRHCRDCARELQSAIAGALAWRRAA